MTILQIMNVEQMARLMYGLDDCETPTKSQKNRVTELCRDGKLEALKVGRRWLIRLTWPETEA